jgi:hypothetical protein
MAQPWMFMMMMMMNIITMPGPMNIKFKDAFYFIHIFCARDIKNVANLYTVCWDDNQNLLIKICVWEILVILA